MALPGHCCALLYILPLALMGPLQLFLFQAARGFWESCSGVIQVMAL